MKSVICVILYTLLVHAAAQGNETEVGGNNETTTGIPEVITTQESDMNTTQEPIDISTTEDYENETLTTTEMPYTNTTEMEEVDNTTVTTARPEPVVCSLPADLDGDWWSTFWGNLTIKNGQLFGVDIDNKRDTVLECKANGDSKGYLIFGEKSDSNSSDSDMFFTCINFERWNRNNFHVQIKTVRNDLYDSLPVVSLSHNDSLDDPKLVCNGMDTNVLNGRLLRKGMEQEGALGCPDRLKGVFNLTFSSLDSAQCPGGAEMSSCEEPKTLSFDYTQCNGTGEYSDTEESICVAGGSGQVTLFQHGQDSSIFECLVLDEDDIDSDSIDVTVTSRACGDDWRSDLPKKEEKTFSLAKSYECDESPTHVTQKPGRREGNEDDAGSSVGPSTLLVTCLVSVIFLVISRVH